MMPTETAKGRKWSPCTTCKKRLVKVSLLFEGLFLWRFFGVKIKMLSEMDYSSDGTGKESRN